MFSDSRFDVWSNECHVRLNDFWHQCTIWITRKLIQESLQLIYLTLVLKRIWRVLCVLCLRVTESNSLVVMGTLLFLGKVSFCLSAGALCLSLSSISCRLSRRSCAEKRLCSERLTDVIVHNWCFSWTVMRVFTESETVRLSLMKEQLIVGDANYRNTEPPDHWPANTTQTCFWPKIWNENSVVMHFWSLTTSGLLYDYCNILQNFSFCVFVSRMNETHTGLKWHEAWVNDDRMIFLAERSL